MEKTMEKLKKEYQILCDKYEQMMDNYTSISDVVDLAIKYRDSYNLQKSNKREMIANGITSIFCAIPYFGLLMPNIAIPTVYNISGLIFIYFLILVVVFGKDTINTIADNAKHQKTSKEFIDQCLKNEGEKLYTKKDLIAYANQLIIEKNKYQVVLEDMLPTITTLKKIINSHYPTQALLEYGESCPIVREALKEEWYAYLDECAKVKPTETRLTTNKTISDNYIRIPEAKPKELVYSPPNHIKLKKQ